MVGGTLGGVMVYSLFELYPGAALSPNASGFRVGPSDVTGISGSLEAVSADS